MILENTRAYTKSQLNTFLPIAISCLLIATFGLISSVAVTIPKCPANLRIYPCGASARRCFGYSTAAIGIVNQPRLRAELQILFMHAPRG